jgi:tetratricopeptide (TPR) repeat protein
MRSVIAKEIRDRLSIIDDELLIPKADAGVLEVASIAIKEALQECYSVLNRGKYRQEEYELLIRLVDLYKRQANTTDKLDYYPKAIGICHYILKLLAEENKITDKEGKQKFVFKLIHDIEADFFQKLAKTSPETLGINRIEKHKKRLTEYREGIRKYLDKLTDLGLPKDSDEINEAGIIGRAKKVEEIYLDIRKFFIGQEGKGGLFNELFSECINDLGGLPKVDDRDVGYAVYGLGSMALGTMTPWSDVEFGILIEEGLGEEKEQEVKQFFRRVSTLLHIRVINFGESAIRLLGIKELNDFKITDHKDPDYNNDWFYDNLITSGFSFDGPHWHACKTPLGRKGYRGHEDFELIGTVQEILKFQEDKWFESDKYLSHALTHTLFMQGNEELLKTYQEKVIADVGRQRALDLLENNLQEFKIDILGQEHHGKILNIKKEVYRFADRVILDLGNLYDIKGNSTIDVISLLEKQKIINVESASNLKVLLGISMELRLRGYAYNGGQKETLAVTRLFTQGITNEKLAKGLSNVYRIQDLRLLYRYYYTAIALQRYLNTEGFRKKEICYSENFDDRDNPFLKMMVYLRFSQYGKALTESKKDMKKKYELYTSYHIDIVTSYINMGLILQNLGNEEEALVGFEKALKIMHNLDSGDHDNTANLLDSIGLSLAKLGHNWRALPYHQESLEMRLRLYGDNHIDIVRSLSNIGCVYANLKQFEKALCYLENALQRMPRGDHAYVAALLHNIGNVFKDLKQYNEAFFRYEESLAMKYRIYGERSDHLDIAGSLYNIGTILMLLGRHEKALDIHKESLTMRCRIYGERADHPDIADSLYSIGAILMLLGCHEKALERQKESLKMRRRIYKGDHPAIAHSLNIVSSILERLGRYEGALKYQEESLEMCKKVYPKTHPIIKEVEKNVFEVNGYAEIEKIIMDSFKKLKLSDSCADATLTIKLKSQKEKLFSFCKTQLRSGVEVDEIGNGEYCISLDGESISILRKKQNSEELAVREEKTWVDRISPEAEGKSAGIGK